MGQTPSSLHSLGGGNTVQHSASQELPSRSATEQSEPRNGDALPTAAGDVVLDVSAGADQGAEDAGRADRGPDVRTQFAHNAAARGACVTGCAIGWARAQAVAAPASEGLGGAGGSASAAPAQEEAVVSIDKNELASKGVLVKTVPAVVRAAARWSGRRGRRGRRSAHGVTTCVVCTRVQVERNMDAETVWFEKGVCVCAAPTAEGVVVAAASSDSSTCTRASQTRVPPSLTRTLKTCPTPPSSSSSSSASSWPSSPAPSAPRRTRRSWRSGTASRAAGSTPSRAAGGGGGKVGRSSRARACARR
jgi:hypothetical protein